MKFQKIYEAVFAVTFSLFIGVTAVSAEEPKTLSAADIKKAFIGNTMDHEKVWVFWGPEGQLRAKSKRGPTETGTYSISDKGIYCRKWDNWRGGLEQCGNVGKAGDMYARIVNGIVESTFTILKGNSEGL